MNNEFYCGQKLKIRVRFIENATFYTINNLMRCVCQNYKKKNTFGPEVKLFIIEF